VNLGPEESKTALLPIETLQKLGVPLKTEARPDPKQAALAAKARQQMQAVELESRQKLWRWLIVIALVVLMMETWLAGRITRRAAVTESPT
jgi:anti-sigma-K factor RskA